MPFSFSRSFPRPMRPSRLQEIAPLRQQERPSPAPMESPGQPKQTYPVNPEPPVVK